MKKLVLSLAVVFAVGMVSCGGNDKAKEEACDSTNIEMTETVVDTTAAPAEDVAPATDSQKADQPAEEAPAADSTKEAK